MATKKAAEGAKTELLAQLKGRRVSVGLLQGSTGEWIVRLGFQNIELAGELPKEINGVRVESYHLGPVSSAMLPSAAKK
jgi:hypothetical protein